MIKVSCKSAPISVYVSRRFLCCIGKWQLGQITLGRRTVRPSKESSVCGGGITQEIGSDKPIIHRTDEKEKYSLGLGHVETLTYNPSAREAKTGRPQRLVSQPVSMIWQASSLVRDLASTYKVESDWLTKPPYISGFYTGAHKYDNAVKQRDSVKRFW